MTIQADQMRNRRRHVAAPGGAHDRMVRWLAIVLPGLVGVVAALMLLTPLSPRGEVSFLLDRNEVNVAQDRLRVDNAMYRGQDNRGRPFSLRAGEAVQESAATPVVEMNDLIARILLPDGPAMLQAGKGRYNFGEDKMFIDGMVRFTAADGYRMSASNVTVNLADKTLYGDGRVEGSGPAGTFHGDAIRGNLADRTLSLEGNAGLRMIPNKVQTP
ncbi:LPS export ABC transporter periplasmic protein LptC [Altericroceibacterium spongiae]|uniref:LPS export ABC transporter periplasmic protein LptC n=1 Tax=Altericroceibacterium spongiae TaxID=2320269 RepID=A0A420EPB9_9SPHN|nr:LPS export ABC transporter periplasmic protein LptC [Altericroceibacterium spongiae]RKF22511.1 LPS export ABC transporter periplasmic protein LptC [Altericroceibacterium spongiae]